MITPQGFADGQLFGQSILRFDFIIEVIQEENDLDSEKEEKHRLRDLIG